MHAVHFLQVGGPSDIFALLIIIFLAKKIFVKFF